MKLVVKVSALAVLIIIQTYWFLKAFEANVNQFDHTVSVALFAVADTMSENVSVKKKSSNFFYVTTNSPMSNRKIDTLIRKEFYERNLLLDYEVGVYNAEDDSLVYGNYVKKAIKFPQETTCNDLGDINKNFAVLFPTRKSYLVAQMDVWIFTTFVLIFISWLYLYLTRYFQNKSNSGAKLMNDQISIGSSCLDFHNQNLTVCNDSLFRLTYKESQILKLLFENPNQVINREVFLKTIWEKDGFFVARSMDVFISRVRKYLKEDHDIKIENLRSIGYRLNVKR